MEFRTGEAASKTNTPANALGPEPHGHSTAGLASWEASLLLPKGRYRLSATVTCDAPVFRGPNAPVSLRALAGIPLQAESLRKDAQHLELIHEFAIIADTPDHAVFQCETRSPGGRVFDFGPMVLTRVE